MWTRVLVVALVLFAGQGVGAGQGDEGDWTPRPDPTRLTTQALQREIAALRELFVTRLDAMDKALVLLQSRADREPSVSNVALQVSGLKDLTNERFAGVDDKFRGVSEQFKANAGQVDAALVAAKELVLQQNTSFAESNRKAEVDTKGRLDQLTALFQTETRALALRMEAINKSLDDKIAAVNTRLLIIEGTGAGTLSQRAAQESSNTMILGVIGAMVGLAGLGIAIALALRRQTRA